MPAIDVFSSSLAGLESPCEHAFDITPNDSTDLAYVTRGIWVGTGGNLKVITKGGETVTFTNIPNGTLKEGRYVRVLATGTTASGLVGEY